MRDGGVSTNEQLADVLRQMAELPCERLDDWAVLILSSADAAQEELPQAVSMLAEEEESMRRTRVCVRSRNWMRKAAAAY